jgi:hypothetical protein
MTDDGTITNRMLLEHMQGQKNELMQRIEESNQELKREFGQRFDRLEREIRNGFEEAHQHRQALQEDLEVTMKEQFAQKRQIAAMAGSSVED